MRLALGYRGLRQRPILAGPLKSIISIGTTGNTAPSNTTVKYTPLCGGSTINGMWQSASSRPEIRCCAGIYSSLFVRLPVALLQGSWTFTLVVNGADSALSVTIDTATSGFAKFDLAHSIVIADGDAVCLKSAPSGTPTAQTIIQFGLLFVAANSQIGPLFATFSSGGFTDIAYGAFGTINSGTQAEQSRRAYSPTSGALSKLRIGNNNAPGAGQSRSVTLMVNGIDKLTATISDSELFHEAAGNVSWAPGDLIQLRRYSSAGAANSLCFVGGDWNPAIAGESIFFSAGTGNFDSATTLFQNLSGTSENTETTEANTFNPMPIACALAKWRADLGVAPGSLGSGKARIMTIRQNSQDSAAAITVSETAQSGSWAGNLPLAAGDRLDWKEAPINTPAASNPLGTSGVLIAA